MIRRHHIRAAFAALLAIAVPSAQAAQVLDFSFGKARVDAAADFGGQKVDVRGSEQKLSEYRDVRDGFFAQEILFSSQGERAPYYMDFGVKNATREDESYKIDGGLFGVFHLGASFARLPHNFDKGFFLLGGAGSRNLVIDSQTQAALQAVEETRADRGLRNPFLDTTGEDAATRGIIQGLLSSKDPTVFKLDRERAAFTAEFTPFADGNVWIKASKERRNGFREIGSGTYERWNQGANGLPHTKDLFLTQGLELAEPVDYRTLVFNTGLGVYKKEWSADLEYTMTDFSDKNASLVWANPFRAADATATSEAGAAAVLADNGYSRGRFARGQMALPPSSRSHEASASGSVELPFHSRLTAAIGAGVVRQDEPLLPFTLNSAMAGVAGAPTNVTSVNALPDSRFKGEVRTLTQSYVLTSKPVDSLLVKAKYRYYDYHNNSDRMVFPGYAAYGESFWRAAKNATLNNGGAGVYNEPASYTRQTGELGTEYEVFGPLSLKLDGFWDQYAFRDTRLSKTNESGVGAGFDYHAGRLLKAHGGYKYSHRVANDYRLGDRPENPEEVGLVNYNWADRVRHSGNVGVDVTPTEALTVGVSGTFTADDLGTGNRFGLKKKESRVIGANAAYEPSEKVSLSVDYTREYGRSRMQNAAKDDAFDGASSIDNGYMSDAFNPLNYWNTDIEEDVDTIALDAVIRPVEALEMNAGYSFSNSRMAFETTNPNAAEAAVAGFGGTKLENGAAQEWPDVTNRLHEVRAGLAYSLVKDLKVGLNYLYERYSVHDFANTQAYGAWTTAENSTRFLMAGSNQYGYTAHVVGTNVSWKF
ncbi:MAG: MtrB/PioB family outer membrane beta-barrel protein [Elusimicrobia bacterium]|nr:MtrB/PioB family outer membrane beta-barrel protein [Elusimicrobiota bacterium]